MEVQSQILLAGRCSDNDDDTDGDDDVDGDDDDDVDGDDDDDFNDDDDQTMITMFPGCRGGDSGSARRAEDGFEAR